MIDPVRVRLQAQREFEQELFDEAVAAELRSIRDRHNRSLWRRFIDWLPFNIQPRKPK